MASHTTAIIVNWNGARFLKPLLDSLKDQNLCATMIVDNASTDSSLAELKAYPDIRLISNVQNVGFGVAANQGIQSTDAPFVLILNVDVRIAPGAVNVLEKFLLAHPDTAIAAPQLLNPDASLQPSCRTFPTILKYVMYLSYLDRFIPTGYRLSETQHSAEREVDQPMGAVLLIRRAALQQTGLFDPQFTLYMEDVDLCERLKRAGWKIYYVPEAKVIHHAGGSTDQDWKRAQTLHLQNLLRYFNKRVSSFRMVLLRLCLSTALIFRGLANLFIGKVKRSLFFLAMSLRVLWL